MKTIKSMLRNKKAQASAIAMAMVVSVQSHAETDLTGPAVDVITTDGTAAITAIGGAMLALAAVAVVFKWAKAAIFG